MCDDDKLVGMITDRDIAVRGTAQGRGPDTTVSDLMSERHHLARNCDDSVETIARQMSDRQVRRMPVIDREPPVVGIVSLGDLSREADEGSAPVALEGVSQEGGSTSNKLAGSTSKENAAVMSRGVFRFSRQSPV